MGFINQLITGGHHPAAIGSQTKARATDPMSLEGTGIVTSVPSDSPDDYAAYMDLMKSGALLFRQKWVQWLGGN